MILILILAAIVLIVLGLFLLFAKHSQPLNRWLDNDPDHRP